MNTLTIFTDGASRGNPGEASCGFAIFDHETLLLEKGVYLGHQTNNTAEYMGVIESYRWIIKNFDPSKTELQFKMDSMLVAHQMRGEWKIKHEHLRNLYFTAKQYEEKFLKVSYIHIRREFNSHADSMANKALDEVATSGQV